MAMAALRLRKTFMMVEKIFAPSSMSAPLQE
jgi:hypothetical protein